MKLAWCLLLLGVLTAVCESGHIIVKYQRFSNGTVLLSNRRIAATVRQMPPVQSSTDADDFTPNSVLIQAPMRKIRCDGNRKLARGRCRDVWGGST